MKSSASCCRKPERSARDQRSDRRQNLACVLTPVAFVVGVGMLATGVSTTAGCGFDHWHDFAPEPFATSMSLVVPPVLVVAGSFLGVFAIARAIAQEQIIHDAQ